MESRINLLITFQDYLKTIDFFKKPRKEQVAYMLYYVTHIAELRTDMQPHIICHRINDQLKKERGSNEGLDINHPYATEEEIRDIMYKYQDYFDISSYGDNNRDRKTLDDKTAFVLSKSKTKELDKEFNRKLKQRYIRKMAYEKIWIILLFISIFFLLCKIGMDRYNYVNKMGISLKEYRNRTNFDYLDDKDKALYFLFYITEIDQIKNEMAPKSISDRLYDRVNARISPDIIKKYFDSSDLVIESRIPNEYRMSPIGRDKLAKQIHLNLDYTDQNIFGFICSNTIFSYGALSIALLTALITAVFSFGFLFGKKLNYPD